MIRKAFVVGVSALCLVSCAHKATIDMTVDGIGEEKLALYRLDVSSSQLLDSVKTDAGGRFKYALNVEEGQPEFVYVYRGDAILASLLLEKGQKAVVKADTLGHYSVIGSEGSAKLAEVQADYNAFYQQISSQEDLSKAVKAYIDYYHGRVSYVMRNCKSLTVIPVFYQQLSPGVPIFSQPTDAVLFRRVCDSLKTVYPDSRFVKALEVETKARENQLGLNLALSQAQSVGFPELSLPGINGEKVSLSGVKAKAILLHFWTDTQDVQKLFNTEILLPLYKQYHKKGFEIYSVCLSNDKALWASVVRNQKLPWINVCDVSGAASAAASLYNVTTLPYSILITDGEIKSASINGEADLKAQLDKVLK